MGTTANRPSDACRAGNPGAAASFSWGVLFLLLLAAVTVSGAALRLPELANRPMHCDEAVQAIKFGSLLEEGRYVYDPHEYHGPTLNYLTLPIARLASVEKLTEVSEVQLRLVPAIFGIGLIALAWLVRKELGPSAAWGAALLTAVSPVMVFFSRYYIHEMLLVVFTFTAMACLWRYARSFGANSGARGWFRRIGWLVLLGMALGLMHATKETCVIPLAAMAAAAVMTIRGMARSTSDTKEAQSIPLNMGATAGLPSSAFENSPENTAGQASSGTQKPRNRHLPRAATCHKGRAFDEAKNATGTTTVSGPGYFALGWPILLVALPVAACTSALWFSSFGQNPRGIFDSLATYVVYLSRGAGDDPAAMHCYPWHYYLRLLFWWHRDGSPLYTEAAIGALALVGLAAGVLGRGLRPAAVHVVRFLGIFSLVMIVGYSALPYKTPWCVLGMLHGIILLAGVGMAVVVRVVPGYVLKAAAVVLLAVAVAHLAWQSHRASFVLFEDEGNPCVYSSTSSDAPGLAERIRDLAIASPDGLDMHVQMICPEVDYWPLPWYLRDMRQIGYFSEVPGGKAAPLIVTKPALRDDVLVYVMIRQKPGERYLREELLKPDGEAWQLRPNVPLLVIVWKSMLDAERAKGRDGTTIE